MLLLLFYKIVIVYHKYLRMTLEMPLIRNSELIITLIVTVGTLVKFCCLSFVQKLVSCVRRYRCRDYAFLWFVKIQR